MKTKKMLPKSSTDEALRVSKVSLKKRSSTKDKRKKFKVKSNSKKAQKEEKIQEKSKLE